MTIRRLVQGVFATLTIIAVIVVVFIIVAVSQRRSLVELQQRRFRSYQQAGDLRHSSDQLTQFARMYVSTGDLRYEQYYRDVLAIRDGTKPRPEQYEKVYWDLYLDGHRPPRGDGPPMALRELLRQSGSNESEIALLTAAEDRSNALAKIEAEAMHAVRGEFSDGQGGFTRRGPPDRALAVRLMHDAAYLRAKADIMRPIGEFLAAIDARTAAELDAFTRTTRVWFAAIQGLLVVFLVIVLVSYPILRSRILVPVTVLQGHTRLVARDLDRLATAANDIAQGDLRQSYAVDTEPIKSTRPDEIGDLSRLHDEMIGQLQSAGGSIATITSGLKRAHEISKQRFVAIFQESPVPLTVTEAATGKIVEANRATVDLIGAKSLDDVLGKTGTDLGIWSNDERRTHFIEPLARDGKVSGLNANLRRFDGTDRVIEIWATKYEAEGVPYVLSSTIDVTDRVRAEAARQGLEEQLRQSQKMESMGRLAGGIAHDFNNLLTVIIGYGQMLLLQMPKGERSAADVQEMVKAAERAAEMTRQLLMFARKQVVETKELKINKVLTGVEKMLKRMIGDDVVLSTMLAPDIGTIKSDSGQLEQIMANLSLNARDAMPTGGTITITTANVHVDAAFVARRPEAKVGPYVRLSVADSGSGIDPDIMPRIFEPFFTTKEVGKGTGLGLSTVFGIMQQSNGFVVVDSVVGRGTAFHLHFPRVGDAATSASGRSDATPSKGGRETILIAEDNTVLKDLMARVLSDRGYYVLPTNNGDEAIALADKFQGSINMLLTDVVMPGMSGRALAEGLTRRWPSMRVLYVSGYPDEVLGRHGALDANIHLLPKPFTPEALAGKVREVLDA